MFNIARGCHLAHNKAIVDSQGLLKREEVAQIPVLFVLYLTCIFLTIGTTPNNTSQEFRNRLTRRYPSQKIDETVNDMAGTDDEQARPGQFGDYGERLRRSQRLQDNTPVPNNRRLSRSRSLPLNQYEYMEHPQQTPTTSSDPLAREAGRTDLASSDTPVEDVRASIVDSSLVIVHGSQYVAALPTVSLTELGDDEADRQCVVCRNTYGADPVILPCKHVFDKECLLSWLSEDEAHQNTCPMCRRQLFRKRNLGNGGNDVYTEGLFDPLVLHDGFEYIRGPGRPSFGRLRAYVALRRRRGALDDRFQYEDLRNDGANLPALAPRQVILNIQQDHLLFQELQSQGAFTLPGMDLQFRAGHTGITDEDIYEILRDTGADWCTEQGRWRLNGRPQRFGEESAEERQGQEAQTSSNLQNLAGVVRRAWNSLQVT